MLIFFLNLVRNHPGFLKWNFVILAAATQNLLLYKFSVSLMIKVLFIWGMNFNVDEVPTCLIQISVIG